MNIQRKWLALALVITAGTGIMAGIASAGASQDDNTGNTGFTGKLKAWQEEMSRTFQETWDKLWKESEAKGHLLGNASVDLREQEKDYIIRASFPGRTLSKVEITLDGNVLEIEAPAEGKLGGYRQAITLASVKPNAQPAIERKAGEGLMVITIPKTAAAEDNETLAETPFVPLTDWERDVFSRMERMQKEMDRIFNLGFDEFRSQPLHRRFYDRSRFGSSYDLKEEGGNYVIRAWLPGRDMNKVDVNVNVENRALKIEAKAEGGKSDDRPDKESVSRKTYYSQILTLPGPVDAAKVKVERKEGMLLITVPKASEG